MSAVVTVRGRESALLECGPRHSFEIGELLELQGLVSTSPYSYDNALAQTT